MQELLQRWHQKSVQEARVYNHEMQFIETSRPAKPPQIQRKHGRQRWRARTHPQVVQSRSQVKILLNGALRETWWKSIAIGGAAAGVGAALGTLGTGQ